MYKILRIHSENHSERSCNLKNLKSVCADFTPKRKRGNMMYKNHIKEKLKTFPRKQIYLITALAVVMTMSILTVSCNKKDVQEEATSDYVFYVQNNEIQYADLEKIDAIQPKQLTEKLLKSEESDIYGFNKDVDLILKNHAVIYPDHSDQGQTRFFYKFFDKENEQPQMIDYHVQNYLLSEDKENMLYVQEDRYSLYQWDFVSGKKEKLTEYVGEYYFSKDGKKICFTDEHGDLYIKAKNKEAQKIAENVHYIDYFNEDFTKFVYGKDGNLYLYHAGKEEKIADDIITLGFFENGEGYYLTDRKMVPWEELIEDDVASNSPKKEYVKALNEEGAYEYGWSVNTLWYFDGEKSHKLTDRYLWFLQSIMPDVAMSGWLPQDRAQIFFREHDAKSFQKIKLSQLQDEYELLDKIFEEYQRSAAFFVAIKDRVMSIPGVVAENVSIDPTGSKLYFFKNPDESDLKGDLYKIELSEDAVSEPIFVADNVSLTRKNVLSDGTEIYFKFKDEFVGDLYINGKKTDEDVDMYRLDYDEKTKTLMYFTNWNRGIDHGDLKTCVNGENKFIANNVYDAYFTDSGKVLYLTNTEVDREENNKLFVYNGEKSERIAQNIQQMIFIRNERRDPI